MHEHTEFLSSHTHRKWVRSSSSSSPSHLDLTGFLSTGGEAVGTDLGADFVETRGDGSGGSITSEHVALEHPCVFVPRHVGKIPETQKPVKREQVNWERR